MVLRNGRKIKIEKQNDYFNFWNSEEALELFTQEI
jgi:hypothetical protein